MADDLKVRMGVDINGVLQGMKRAEKSLEDFKNQAARFKQALDKATDPKSIERLNRAIESTNAKIKLIQSAGTKSFDNIKTGANRGAAAMTDFNRILQDSPYGIIGISNNITQLGESFGRLKVETGSTKGALQAMLASLSGGGGIGLAITAVTTALTFASVGLSAWTRGLKDSKDQIEKTKNAHDEIIKSLGEEKVKVDLIIAAINNENLSRKQRQEAIRQLQAISPAYFGTLNTEKATVEQIAAAYNKYSQSIIRNISAKVKEKDLLTITEKILKLEEKGQNVGQQQIVQDGKLITVTKARMQGLDEAGKSYNAYQEYQRGTIGLTIKEKDELENLRIAQQKLIKQIAAAKGSDPFIKVDKPVKEAKIKVEKVEIEPLKEVNFGKQISVLPTPGGLPTEVTIPIIPRIEVPPIDQDAYKKMYRALQIDEGIKGLATQMQDTVSNSFGDAIANGLSGKSAAAIFGNFFKTILTTLGQGIQQIGVQTLLAGKAIMAVKSLFGSAAGIGASIALIALGGIIKGLASKIEIPGFADGVTNFRGGLAMVGERGPELVRLPKGSDVVPNHSLGNIGGGMSMNLSGNFRVAGTDLVLVLDRAQRSQSRVG